MKKLLAGLALMAAALTAHATQTPVVKNVRFGCHAKFDRVVIDINGHHPQVRVTKPYSLRHDGSGNPTSLQGKANIHIALNPATGHDENGGASYRGPRKIADVRMRYVHGFQVLGDFEAVFSIGLTTDISNPKVRVTKLNNPTRIVVDIYK